MARYIEAEEARSVLLMRMAGTGYQSRAMNAIYDVPTAYGFVPNALILGNVRYVAMSILALAPISVRIVVQK